MTGSPPAQESGAESGEPRPDLRDLFHRLNNQLGIILAHAELLELRAADAAARSRATQVVASVLDAMRTARDIRRSVDLTAA